MHCGEAFAEFEQLQAHMKTYYEDEEEINMKKGGKGLKNASFGVKNFKKFRGGIFRPPPLHPCTTLPQTYLSKIT